MDSKSANPEAWPHLPTICGAVLFQYLDTATTLALCYSFTGGSRQAVSFLSYKFEILSFLSTFLLTTLFILYSTFSQQERHGASLSELSTVENSFHRCL